MAEDFTPKKNELTNQDAMAIPDSTHAQDSASVVLPAFDGLKKPGKISGQRRNSVSELSEDERQTVREEWQI